MYQRTSRTATSKRGWGEASLRLAVAISLLAIALRGTPSDTLKAIRFGKLIDSEGAARTNVIVVVDGDRVKTFVDTVPAGAELIDLSSYTGLPGLIDAHVHMTYYWDRSPGTRPFAQGSTRAAAVTVFLAQENARRTLEAGVTTVRDLGAGEGMSFAMRDLINRGALVGPRMFVCGNGLSVSRSSPRPGAPANPGQADGPAEVMRAARQQIASGAEWVKLFGSTGSGNDVTGYQTFTFEE